MKLIAPIFIVMLLSCSDIEQPVYKSGDIITLKDNRIVTVEKQIPAGYLVYTANKYQVYFFPISKQDIK